MADALESTEKAQEKKVGTRQLWVNEIHAAMKREQDYRKLADRVVDIYEAKRNSDYQNPDQPRASTFNILYSNTETLLPALYNSTPRPVVKRRFFDADALGLEAAKAATRALAFLIDSGNAEYASFDEIMQEAVLQATVPGRGVSWVKYDAEFEVVEAEAPEGGDGDEAGEPAQKVSYETACWEQVPWNRFLMGFAKKWSEVPWVGREHLMTAEELVKNFGKEKAARFRLVSPLSKSWDGTQGQKEGSEGSTGMIEVAFVYEIWDKVSRRVIFVSEQYEGDDLKEVDDPLGLSGFFPCAKPLQLIATVSDLTPIPLYQMYEDQAKELNDITNRLKWLIRALRVRGFYNGLVQEIENVLNAADNTLLPIQSPGMMEGKGIEGNIWLVPIDMIVSVVQSLYVQREQIKQVIYEITGIADIMRGSSNAQETLGAQEIKNQWGTLRLKRMQRKVQAYARDTLRITAEICCKQFSEETFAAMTGLPYPTSAQQAQAQAELQSLEQQAAMMPPQMGADGQPMQQQPNPRVEQLKQIVEMPSWGDILNLLRNDLLRNYRIDIETNSTIDIDATEDKKEIGDFMNALAQVLNGIAPAVEGGIFSMEVGKEIVMTILRKFRFTDEVEPLLLKAKQQPQQPNQAEQIKAQAELQKIQLEMERDKEQVALDREKLTMEKQKLQMQAMYEQEEHKLKMQELVMKHQIANARFAQQMAMAQQKAKAPKPAGEGAAAA